jgi:hypothetical protein
MVTRTALVFAAVFATALAVSACNRDTASTPKPKTEAPGSIGGPGATSGGLKGDAAGGTQGGAATSSTPQGPGTGAGTARTDNEGMSSRPTENPAGK